MADVLDYTEKPSRIVGRWVEADWTAKEQPVHAASGKELFRAISRMSSVDTVQNGWPRIVLHDVWTSIEPEEVIPLSGILIRTLLNQSTEKRTPVSFDSIVNWIVSDGRKSVFEFVRALRKSEHSREVILVISRGLAKEIGQANEQHRISVRGKTTESFLDRAQRLDKHGRVDAALDLIYDSVDEMMRSGDFNKLDALLTRLQLSELSTDLLIGLLTATLPARGRLATRKSFFCRVEEILRQRGEYENSLLMGLD